MFQSIANLITYQLFQLQPETQLANAVNFFFYDVLKILFLIFAVVTVIAFIRSFFDPARFKQKMMGLKWGTGNITAAVFGVATLVSMVGTTMAGLEGLKLVRLGPLERWAHVAAGCVIAVAGLSVIFLGL